MHSAWGSAYRQMVLIYPSTSCLFIWRKSGRGQRETWSWGGGLHGRRPPTNAAESYLCSSSRPRRPQSRRRRNRRCRFSSWRSRSGTGARGRLTAALQGEGGREKVRMREKRYERVGGMGNYFLIWEITLLIFLLSWPFHSQLLPCHLTVTSLDKTFYESPHGNENVWIYWELFEERSFCVTANYKIAAGGNVKITGRNVTVSVIKYHRI